MLLQQPFMQVTLPIMVTFVATIWLASWSQNKRFDEVNRRLDAIEDRLKAIEKKLDDHTERITRLEERTSLLGRHG
jgi:predicted  nucleic acid-binding Zn-ribbon protein